MCVHYLPTVLSLIASIEQGACRTAVVCLLDGDSVFF